VSFRVRRVDVTATGREIVRERTVEGDILTVGRAAENDIAVPDLAVEQHHVRVAAVGRALTFTALGTLGFTLDGRSVAQEAAADGGAELVIGAWRIDFAAGPDGEIEVTVRPREDREGGTGAGHHGFTLASALPAKRPVAWALLAAIFLAFLIVPIWSSLHRERIKPDIDRGGQVMMDASWSTGALSTAHAALQNNCEACHVDAFVAVRDNACLACHATIGDHAPRPRLTLARGPLDWGDRVQREVADLFHKPGAGACTDCHTEHEGEGRMHPPAQKFCADCHGTMDTRLRTPLGNASDFGTVHPQFQPAVLTAMGAARPTRISLDARPREFNGLKFPHALHLSASGGPARMAGRLGSGQGPGKALACADCHRPTRDGVRFAPVNMERSCGGCHSLVYARGAGGFRTLPHGNIAAMRAALASDNRAPRQPIASGRRRPGQFAPGGTYYSSFTPPQRASVPLASRMLSVTGVCSECHYPASGGSNAGVMKVTQPSRYFAHGWFDHASHAKEPCGTCHTARTSQSATDVLLPPIKVCRECHLGEDAARPKVPSGCAMCHSFHPRGGAAPARVGQITRADQTVRRGQTAGGQPVTTRKWWGPGDADRANH
jgi:hypothetical protein